jgi:hypothetical protein
VSDPTLVARDALAGASVGLSVSDSADLPRLGLTSRHCHLAVAELARAIFIAGGSVCYGGRLAPAGLTDVLLDEATRYVGERDALVLCVPETEHHHFSSTHLEEMDRRLPQCARMVLLDGAGAPLQGYSQAHLLGPPDPSRALSAMRRYITDHSDARVVVGGQLSGYQGAMPGVIEEVLIALDAGQPLYVAGGFGGAAAAAVGALQGDGPHSSLPDYPEHVKEVEFALAELRSTARSKPPAPDGLEDYERRQLAVTYRPAEIASLTVVGLARLRAKQGWRR